MGFGILYFLSGSWILVPVIFKAKSVNKSSRTINTFTDSQYTFVQHGITMSLSCTRLTVHTLRITEDTRRSFLHL
jgi:hypothetical protein